jgi:sarcosine oxidase
VLLVDAWGPGHSRSSSGGESRIIRMGYGADAIYTRMAQRSLKLWKALFEEVGQGTLFHPTGVLWIGREDDPYTCSTRSTLTEAGVPVEILSSSELARRYPQVISATHTGEVFGILEPESGALLARRAVAAVVEDAIRRGVEYARELVLSPSTRSLAKFTRAGGMTGECARDEVQRGARNGHEMGNCGLRSLRTASGEAIHADQFVFACGPWLAKLFPDLLGNRIYPTRQEALFFAPPAGDRRFAPPQLPIWLDFTDPRGPYVFPDLEGRGVKLAFDRHGPAFDPDSGDRTVSAESVEQARQFLEERFPALRDAPLTETRVCQYENTSNGDFLIDRHPDFENVWLVGGGSGHGFKHGPALGEHVAARMIQGAPEEPRFSLASKGETQSRTVY